MLAALPYRFLARPRAAATDPHPQGVNCRSLVQDYLEDRHGVFLPRDAMEHPGIWHVTGAFVPIGPGQVSTAATPETAHHHDPVGPLHDLPDEAILLAERIRDGAGRPIDRSPAAFDDVETYRLHLHTAVLLHAIPEGLCDPGIPRVDLRPGEPAVLHATAAAGTTCLWSPRVFARNYRLVAAKVVAPSDDHAVLSDRPGDVQEPMGELTP